jgi:hypothetical protein
LDGLQGIGDLIGSDGGDVVFLEEGLDFGDCFGAIAADILQIDLARRIVSGAFLLKVGGHMGTHPQEVEVGQIAVARFGAAQAHNDDADQGGESEDIRREDTRDATGFTHDGSGLRVNAMGKEERKG